MKISLAKAAVGMLMCKTRRVLGAWVQSALAMAERETERGQLTMKDSSFAQWLMIDTSEFCVVSIVDALPAK